MPRTLKTTRLWSTVLAAVLVAGAVSAMSERAVPATTLPQTQAL